MAADAFRRAGYEAYSLDGGLEAWAGGGRPLEPEGGSVAATDAPARPAADTAAGSPPRRRRGGAGAGEGRRLRHARARDGPPGDQPRCSWSSRPGGCRLVATARRSRRRSSTSARHGVRRASAGCCRSPSRPTTRPAALFYVYLTARPAGRSRCWSTSVSAPTRRGRPGSGPAPCSRSPPAASNHNGGQLQFGPDGLLWIGTGDGGGGDDQSDHAPEPGVAAGQAAPASIRARGRDRPASRSARVCAFGLRNPWRFSFDRADGRPRDRRRRPERLRGDRPAAPPAAAGANYGWPCFEGFARRRHQHGPALRRRRRPEPVLERPRTRATASARSPAATSSATPGCRRCRAATSTATSALGAALGGALRPGDGRPDRAARQQR